MGITEEVFGVTKNGETINRYTLVNKNKLKVQVISYGAILTAIEVPDRKGNFSDIIVGHETLAEFEDNPCYFGAICGRVCNRIHKGEFSLDGETYKLAVNNGPNHLHGGIVGFNKKVWQGSIEDNTVKLEMTSPDGDEGYPGEVTTQVLYQLNDENELVIEFNATSSKPTPINLTSHGYFNLAGHKHPDIYDHTLMINSAQYTPKNEDQVPTGAIAPVEGTHFDFRQPVVLGEKVHDVPNEDVSGFDNTFCLVGPAIRKFAARVVHPGSGRSMEVYTTQPSVHLYTAQYVDSQKGKDGATYQKHCSFCLETQNYPDAIHHSKFPDCVLRPEETYKHTTWYKFGIKV